MRTNGSFTTRAGRFLSRICTGRGRRSGRPPAARTRSILHRRRERAARDLAFAVRRDDLLVRAQRAAGLPFSFCRIRPTNAARAVGFQCGAADEVARSRDRPSTRGPRRAATRCRPCPQPYRFMPASRRSVSRAPSRTGARRFAAARSTALRRARPGRSLRNRLHRCSRCATVRSPERRAGDLRGVERLQLTGGGARGGHRRPRLSRAFRLNGDDREIAARRNRDAEAAFARSAG